MFLMTIYRRQNTSLKTQTVEIKYQLWAWSVISRGKTPRVKDGANRLRRYNIFGRYDRGDINKTGKN